MEEAPEQLISPRISFSHDLVVAATVATPPAALAGRRSDASLLASRLPEPEFDFANAIAAGDDDDDVAPADRLFAGGKLLPMPPLPPAPKPSPRKQQPCTTTSGSRVKAQAACQQRRPAGSWAPSPFSRSSSVNSAATTATTGAPRSGGRFGCPTFPLMRSWSVGSASAAVAARGDGLGGAVPDAGGHRPHRDQSCYKKLGGEVARPSSGGGSTSRAYYYGGSRKAAGSSSGHGGVRVRPVLNVPFVGTSVSNMLSYLLCDCSHRTKKSREFF